MDVTFVPTPQDANMKMEASISKSASFAGTTFDFGSGFAPGGIGLPAAIVAQVESLTGSGTYTLQAYESSDDNVYTPCGPSVQLCAGGSLSISTAASGALTTGVLSIPFFQTQRYLRGSLTLVGTSAIGLTEWAHPLGSGSPVG